MSAAELFILLVDDNPNDRLLVNRELTLEFNNVRTVQITDADQLNKALISGGFQLVITDFQLRWTDGLTVLRSVKEQFPHCPVIMFTGTGTEEVAVEAMKDGLDDYIVKSPKHFLRLRAAARHALQQSEVREALVESELRYQHLIESAPDIVFATTPDGKICELNPAFSRITGLPVEDSLGELFLSIVHPDDVSVSQNFLMRTLRGETLPPFELRINSKSNGSIVVETKVTPRLLEGKIRGILGIARDITERKQIDEELRASRRRLEMLSQQLILAQEAERRHLARELHDEIGQVLTAIKMNLRRAQRTASSQSSASMDESIAMVDQAIVQVRDLSLSLRPAQLDELGLVAALHFLTNEQARIGEFEANFEFDIGDFPIPVDLQTVCFRIAQEALTNAIRHGNPTKVVVKLLKRDMTLELSILDDGIGFNVSDVWRRGSDGKCFGLTSMQERAHLVGGQIKIESTPGRGTTISAWFPLSQNSD